MGFAAFDDVRDRLCVYDAKFDPESRHFNEIELLLPAPLARGRPPPDDPRWPSPPTEPSVAAIMGASTCVCAGDTFYILDVNPNPDLAYDGSLIVGAEEAGYTQADVVSRLVNLAAARHPKFSGQ